MIVCIEAVAMPLEPGEHSRAVNLYAYQREELPGEGGDDSVQCANHAMEIIDRLTGSDVIIKERPPCGGDYRPLWQVEIQTMNVHRNTAIYRADYHKFPGCPMNAIELMMAVYAAVRRVLKEARMDMRARKAKKHETKV